MVQTVFEDDFLIVVNKPAGLVVTSDETQKGTTLQDILQSEFKIALDRGGIVHRLDKDTSGLLVVAKTLFSLENLQSQFKNHLVKKEYLALVHGNLEKKGKINAPIIRNPGDREKFIVTLQKEPLEEQNAREAVTEYEPIRHLKISDENLAQIFADFSKIQMRKLSNMHYVNFTYLKCHPITGRTHQIRVHLKYIGFPIVADEKYGGRKIIRLDRRWCPRQFLHAAKLEINHPETGKRMVFESPLPEDLGKSMQILEDISELS